MVEAWKPQGRWAEQLWSSVSRPLEQHSSLTAWILTVNTVIIVILLLHVVRAQLVLLFLLGDVEHFAAGFNEFNSRKVLLQGFWLWGFHFRGSDSTSLASKRRLA